MEDLRLRLSAIAPTKLEIGETKAIVQVLLDIKLLCRSCHPREHTSVSNQRNGALVVRAYYGGFEELPDFSTFEEWQDAMRDEADALYEDDWVNAAAEMDDSGFSRCGWINK